MFQRHTLTALLMSGSSMIRISNGLPVLSRFTLIYPPSTPVIRSVFVAMADSVFCCAVAMASASASAASLYMLAFCCALVLLMYVVAPPLICVSLSPSVARALPIVSFSKRSSRTLYSVLMIFAVV